MKALLVGFIISSGPFATAATRPAVRSDASSRPQKETAGAKLRRALPVLRDGDIIFIGVKHPFYRFIAATSQSWESHVGILFRDSKGKWTVAESTIPVSKVTPLDRFVARSGNGRFFVRRLQGGLSPDAVQRLHAATESRMGKLYDPGFGYDSPRQYCSKFVFDSFCEATGQRVGKLETFREMFAENPAAPLGFWRAWFFGRIPWDRRCVTTTSQIRAANLVTVFDSESTAHER